MRHRTGKLQFEVAGNTSLTTPAIGRGAGGGGTAKDDNHSRDAEYRARRKVDLNCEPRTLARLTKSIRSVASLSDLSAEHCSDPFAIFRSALLNSYASIGPDRGPCKRRCKAHEG